MKALAIIDDYYKYRVAERSGIPLINHINEGLIILKDIGVSSTVCNAWCIHPMVMSDEDMLREIADYRLAGLGDTSAIIWAMEYRAIGNTYLSQDVGTMEVGDKFLFKDLVTRRKPIRHMLIADKVQNYKDFRAQPEGTYNNEDLLSVYFADWLFNILGLSIEEFHYYEGLIT